MATGDERIKQDVVNELAWDDRVRATDVNVDVLTWNPDLDVDDLDVSAVNGLVRIRGTARSFWQKSHADDLVLGVEGVMDVDNELVIARTGKLSDQALGEQVRAALERKTLVDHSTVDVVVENGVVTLSGTVPTWAARQAAHEAALYTPDLQGLRNELVITY